MNENCQKLLSSKGRQFVAPPGTGIERFVYTAHFRHLSGGWYPPLRTQNVLHSTFLTKSLSKPLPECPLQSLRRQLPPQGSLGMYPFGYTLFVTASKTARLRVGKLPTPTDSGIFHRAIQRPATQTARLRAGFSPLICIIGEPPHTKEKGKISASFS